MRGKYRLHHILEVVLSLITLSVFSASNSKANENSKYLDAVREFADNVLKYGRDTYGPKHTPLFVDGLNIHTHEPVKWIEPDGTRWILSNLASQQNLFRTLDGLTKITGDPKYRQAAVDAIKYAFENLRSPNGLLYWGSCAAYDASVDKTRSLNEWHVLKAFYPYYELMWEVNPNVTEQIIESFWASHILDWSNLDMNRYGPLDRLSVPKGWDHEYKGGPVFFESKGGLPFITTGSDLYYAAAVLFKLSGQRDPLIWGKRLAHRYVETRDTTIGVSGKRYSLPKNAPLHPLANDFKGHIVHNGTISCDGGVSDPFVRRYLLHHYTFSPGLVGNTDFIYYICQFLIGEMLGVEGREFQQWAFAELYAKGKVTYRREDNSWIPILTDGTSLEGYVCKRDIGGVGLKGDIIKAWQADLTDFWAYTLAYRATGDKFMWEIARSILRGNGLGDIGVDFQKEPQLCIGTECSNAHALLGFLALYEKIRRRKFLKMAQSIADNILANRYHHGFFTPTEKHIYAKFDAIEALVLLHVYVALEHKRTKAPLVLPSRPYIERAYRGKDWGFDNILIYNLTESTDPPISLNEAAAMGKTDLVKSLITKGVDPNNRENGAFRVPLHYAAEHGHKDITEILITSGADVNAKDASDKVPLHYAAEKGHKEIAELLIAHGADINVKDAQGRTPIDLAMERGHREIVKLLLSKSGDVSLYAAAYIGDLQRVEKFIYDGANVDSKDQKGQTALHYAAKAGEVAVAEFLIANGSDVNAGEWTPLQEAAYYSKEMVELLLAKGANINAGKWTALHSAFDAQRFDIVELLLAKGADANIRDDKGRTPLHIAAWYAAGKNPKIVELLLSKGADINAKDNNDKTALSYAIENGHKEIADLLRKQGAKE